MTRVALVTGAAGGIGQATCDVLRAQRWEVVALDRAWNADAPRAGLTVDLADAEATAERLGHIDHVDALVNNAGAMITQPLDETSFEDWDRLMSVNARAAFVCLRTLLPLLRKAKGAVVNIASVHAHATAPSVAAYAASKGALTSFTRAAAVEVAGDGVRVNAVLPGAVDTGMLAGSLDGHEAREQALDDIRGRTPLRRIGEPSDVAEMVAFLVDPERSSFITGQCFVVDGGVLAQLSTEPA